MNIDVIIPSRGRPIQLLSVITCFDALATGEHEIQYRVICDTDDELTRKMCRQMPHVEVVIHSGEGNLSHRMNQAAVNSVADIITGAADDTYPLAQGWDAILEVGLMQGHHVFSWQEVNDPTNHTMIVFSRKWLDAVGRMLPEYFPFWFGDTWVAEVYELAFQRPLPIVQNLQWGGKRGHTKGMHDLAFWFQFFAATRVERIAEARAVCFTWNQPFTENRLMLADMERRDAEQLKRVPHYEEVFGANQGEPKPQYVEMKAAAEAWLNKRSV